MKVLAIDTASPHPSLAISTEQLEGETVLPAGPELSSRILPELARLLASVGITAGSLDRIAVVAGPGSFTGIRIGLATAWGLAAALGTPVELAGTLAAAAEAARPARGPVSIALPAERGDVYFGTFGLGSDRAAPIEPASIISRLDLDHRGERLAFPPDESPPLALALARAVRREPGPAATRMEAMYLRDSAAEERRGTSG